MVLVVPRFDPNIASGSRSEKGQVPERTPAVLFLGTNDLDAGHGDRKAAKCSRASAGPMSSARPVATQHRRAEVTVPGATSHHDVGPPPIEGDVLNTD
jgi:hypothetical protein